MPQLNLNQTRIIDPVLTQVAQGFQQLDLVGSALFPTVNVGSRAGRVVKFGKEDFMLYNTARAPGENTKRVHFGYSSDPFALVDYSLEGSVPIENLQEGLSTDKGFSIDHAAVAVRKVQSIMALRLEKAQADLARTAANYGTNNKVTLSGTDQWSDYGTVSNPMKVVEEAKEAVRAATGRRPNTLVMGAKVMAKLRQHPAIIDRMKYTGRDIPTAEILSGLFGIDRILMGDAIYANDAGQFIDVWGNDVVIAYTETATLGDMGTPTFGYNYQLSGYPMVEEGYYDRNSKTWYFPVSRAEAPVIAGADAGFLIKNAVA